MSPVVVFRVSVIEVVFDRRETTSTQITVIDTAANVDVTVAAVASVCHTTRRDADEDGQKHAGEQRGLKEAAPPMAEGIDERFLGRRTHSRNQPQRARKLAEQPQVSTKT